MGENKNLVQMKGNEKLMVLLDTRSKERAIAEQESFNAGLDRKSSKAFDLFSNLAVKHFPLTRSDVLQLDHDGLQCLEKLLGRRIGIRHRMALLCYKFWESFIFVPAKKIRENEGCGPHDKSEMTAFFSWLAVTGGITTLLTVLTQSHWICIATFLVVFGSYLLEKSHCNPKPNEELPNHCDECLYLVLSRTLEKHRGKAYLSRERIKQLTQELASYNTHL